MAKTPTNDRRTCAGCGESFGRMLLVRAVLSPEGSVEIDYRRKLPGRGAYLCPQKACFEAARKMNGFSRSFRRRPDRYDAERLWETLARANRRSLLDTLVLAAKAGALFSGTDTVQEAVKQGRVGRLLVAENAADRTFRRFGGDPNLKNRTLRALSMDEIGRVLGKPDRAVVAVEEGAFARRLDREYAIYRMIGGYSGEAGPELAGSIVK